MNWTVILIEMLVFAVLFTILVFFSYKDEQKYSIGSIHNYPPEIQEEYFKTHPREDVSYKSKKVILTKVFGILFFVVIIYFCATLFSKK
jgi:Ca2+/Na+ antiporter